MVLGLQIDIQRIILAFEISFREHWFMSQFSTTFSVFRNIRKKF